jgi:hypothetical protein
MSDQKGLEWWQVLAQDAKQNCRHLEDIAHSLNGGLGCVSVSRDYAEAIGREYIERRQCPFDQREIRARRRQAMGQQGKNSRLSA